MYHQWSNEDLKRIICELLLIMYIVILTLQACEASARSVFKDQNFNENFAHVGISKQLTEVRALWFLLQVLFY